MAAQVSMLFKYSKYFGHCRLMNAQTGRAIPGATPWLKKKRSINKFN